MQLIANQPEDEGMLARALAMSNTSEKKQDSDLATMTEKEQTEYAMKMSMQTSNEPKEAVKEEKMEVSKSRYFIRTDLDTQNKKTFQNQKKIIGSKF